MKSKVWGDFISNELENMKDSLITVVIEEGTPKHP